MILITSPPYSLPPSPSIKEYQVDQTVSGREHRGPEHGKCVFAQAVKTVRGFDFLQKNHRCCVVQVARGFFGLYRVALMENQLEKSMDN